MTEKDTTPEPSRPARIPPVGRLARRALRAILILVLPLSAGLGVTVRGDEPSPAAVPGAGRGGEEERLVRLLADLDSPEWRMREAATQALMDEGPAIYETLREAYLSGLGYEGRRRIQRIAREIHMTASLGPGPAFLGISLARGRGLTFLVDARVPADATALLIESVFLGTAADRAGLRPGDLIVTLNGQRATGDTEATQFTTWIARQSPGTPCRLGIIRGGEGFYLSRTRTHGFDYRGFSRVRTRVVSSEEDPRLPEGKAGILLTNVAGADPRLKLKDGDLLVALDNRTLTEDTAAAVFARWVRGQPAAEGPQGAEAQTPIVGPGRPPPGNQPAFQPRTGGDPQGVPSAQILRGGERLVLDVVLGRPPSFLPDRRALVRRMEAGRLESAEAEFESWWREWFTAEARLDPFDATRAWRLDP